MANSIALATQYTQAVDARYRLKSLTANLEVNDDYVRGFDNAGTIQVLSVVTDGLGDYDRTAGFKTGDTTATWASYTIDNDRATSFGVPIMDNAEAGGKIFVQTAKQFMDQQVIPEIDATRFARMASGGTTPIAANLADGDAYLAAIDAGVLAMDDSEVPSEGKTLYLSNAGYSLLKNERKISRGFDVLENGAKVINRQFEELDGMRIVKVPKSRFYTGITLNDGTSSFGYANSGKEINFMIVHKDAVKAITRHQKIRIFPASVNQASENDLYQYRIYHDLIVPSKKTAGVYTHGKA